MTANNQGLQPLVTQQYEAYKNSGVEWLGQVPEHWAIKRLKDISPIITTGGTPSEEYFVETGYKWHTPSDFLSGFYLLSAQKNVTKSIKSKIYPANSILIVSIGGTLGKVGISLEKFSANQQINIVYPASVFNTLFLVYFLSISTKTMKALSNTSTIGIMNQSKTGQIFVPFPPLSEQTAIANYLDQKTAQIDHEIDLLSKKTALYANLKQSLINETVTRGLDKNVALKDSGVEWLGQVPEHWEIKRLKDLSIFQSGYSIVSEQIETEGLYPVYGGNGLRGYFSKYTNNGNYILIGRQGALCGNINYASGKFWASEHAIVVYKKPDINIKWYGEILRVMNLNQYSLAAAQPGLSVDKIRRLLLPFPPISEQKAIADYLDQKTAQIDNMVSAIDRKIATLQELRKTLINDVVTGQIKVV